MKILRSIFYQFLFQKCLPSQVLAQQIFSVKGMHGNSLAENESLTSFMNIEKWKWLYR